MSFGRKDESSVRGLTVSSQTDGYGNSSSTSHSGYSSVSDVSAQSDGLNDPYKKWGMLLLLLVIAFDGAFSWTEIITPIDTSWLYFMRALGALAAVGLLWSIWEERFAHKSRSAKLSTVFFILAFGVMIFDYLAWRVWDYWEFGPSELAFETAYYPIIDMRPGSRGTRDTFLIDPYQTGSEAKLPVPSNQYQKININYKGLCVAVQQRKSPAGAVQIINYGRFTFDAPQSLDVRNCS
jgi:hypothetical protein